MEVMKGKYTNRRTGETYIDEVGGPVNPTPRGRLYKDAEGATYV